MLMLLNVQMVEPFWPANDRPADSPLRATRPTSAETANRGGPTFSDTGISGFLSGHDRREVHAKAEA
jgi:hypothetical protein